MNKFQIGAVVIFGIGALLALYSFFGGSLPALKSPPPAPTLSPTTSPSAASSSPNLSAGARQNRMHEITLKTNFGDITFETYDADAPHTVANFVTLAQKGFYTNLTFHRIVKGFVIQGGDPNGNGTGGPGYTFEDELNPATESAKQGYKKGVVAMANSGSNTNGSQFFIMLADNPLPYNYTIFGKVIKGIDAVDNIGMVAVDAHDKPLKPVVILKVTVSGGQGFFK